MQVEADGDNGHADDEHGAQEDIEGRWRRRRHRRRVVARPSPPRLDNVGPKTARAA